MKWILISLLVISCSKSEDIRSQRASRNKFESSQNYFNISQKIIVDVAYESGQAPYTDLNIQGSPLWQLVEENVNALFLGRSILPQITVPKTLEQMQELPVQTKRSWTGNDLLDIASQYRRGQSIQGESHFFVVFLGGHFSDGTQDYPSTVGVSIGGTTIVAIFKDVVRSTHSISNPLVSRYVEQATVVHELGHALGLVDNGLPMHEAHKDVEHGAHCNNPDCVMYWLNEGHENLKQFVIRMITEGSVVMFDEACLQDSRKF
jgi:hypothetical protein